ncbi:nucleophosmin 1b isoform X1 [Latimeria chalumnae]|uniref:nucleophosmin 1b isoform X1 n=1 Tax=Latimeria chalumnae TaxID=7897 RepID=UPI0006D8EB90|nr:PREDICTED: nucleophosmin-like isoform X1 [Latimeria chalumnae]|eukprot:XP_014339505.1 PREDICTED: nucleophosmin-like isoform X1 [Latimeria chalumnae]
MGEEQRLESRLLSAHIFLFGCELKADKKEYNFTGEDNGSDQQLALRTVCVGAEAKDEMHTVEMEALSYEGEPIRVQLVSLRPSVLTTVNLSGFEVTPPVSFRLKSGSGPIYISGQHLINQEESDESEDEEENNTSPMKRPPVKHPSPSTPSTSLPPVPKKLKLDDDEEEDEEEEDDEDEEEEEEDEEDEEDDSEEEDEEEEDTPVKTPVKREKVTPLKSKTETIPASKENGEQKPGKSPGKKLFSLWFYFLIRVLQALVRYHHILQYYSKNNVRFYMTPGSSKKQGEKSKNASTPKTPPTIDDIKVRLKNMAEKGQAFPKTEQKFGNFLRSSFRLEDKQVVKELWVFKQTLTEK